jgi:hypothetical protein
VGVRAARAIDAMNAMERMPEQKHRMRLLARHDLGGFGNLGEGMSLQVVDGRRILWLAHESYPIDFTALDVTDPRAPVLVAQQKLAHEHLRSNSLEVVGGLMVVAYQSKRPGQAGAGMGLYDVADPANPRRIGFFDASGPHSRGVHQLWFADGERVHMSAGAPDFTPRHADDDQFYRVVDVRRPANPIEAGRWWLPGTEQGEHDAGSALPRTAGKRSHYRVHNTNVYPQRPDRAYLGYLDAGAIVLDIGDVAAPAVVSRWDNSPPFAGFTHTVLPLFGRDLLVVTDESIVDAAADWPKLVWIVDARDERNLVPIATLPLPKPADFTRYGGRFGAHNVHENRPVEGTLQSERYIFGSFFSGGVRVFDIDDPYRPAEVAHYIPAGLPGAPYGAAQINDVVVDDRGIVYAGDRQAAGVYILEWTP